MEGRAGQGMGTGKVGQADLGGAGLAEKWTRFSRRVRLGDGRVGGEQKYQLVWK